MSKSEDTPDLGTRDPGKSLTSKRGVNLGIILALACATAELCGQHDAAAQSNFTITQLSGPDRKGGYVTGINNSGQIVGNEANASVGFLLNLSTNKYVTVSYPNSTSTEPTGVNDFGVVIGTYSDTSGNSHGFLFDGTRYTNKDYKGATNTFLYGINNLGHYVGFAYAGNGYGHVFLFNGAYQEINPPFAPKGAYNVTGINNFDQVVGRYDWNGCECGFEYDNGRYRTVSYPDNAQNWLLGVNGSNQMTGTAIVDGSPLLFFKVGSIYATVEPDFVLNEEGAINDEANIVYNGSNNAMYLAVPSSLIIQEGEDGKATAAELGLLFKTISKGLNGAAVVADGPTGIVKNVAATVFVNVVVDLASRNDRIFGDKTELSLGLLITTKDAFEAFKTNPVSIGLEASALAFTFVQYIADSRAADPPDPNYTTVEQPQTLDFPSTGNPTIDQVIADYMNYISLSTATLHAAERWQGALLAGDTNSETLQSNAYQTYTAEMDTAKEVLQADNATLGGQLTHEKLKDYPGGAKAIAAAFNAQCGKPLPKKLNNVLLKLENDQTLIDQEICKIAKAVRPQDITTQFEKPLREAIP